MIIFEIELLKNITIIYIKCYVLNIYIYPNKEEQEDCTSQV